MSDLDMVYNDINSFGSAGVKKSELKKKYPEDNFEDTLNDLASQDKVCISKKGTFVYCWGKDYYLEYLLSSDIKFKYLYDSIIGIQKKLNNYSDSIFKYVEKIDCELVEVKNSFNRIEDKLNNIKVDPSNIDYDNTQVSIDTFKEHFDTAIVNRSTSIGWVELTSVKNEVCESCDLSNNEFYSLVGELIELYPEKYELSSGGYEGVVLRGIVHGFVRCI